MNKKLKRMAWAFLMILALGLTACNQTRATKEGADSTTKEEQADSTTKKEQEKNNVPEPEGEALYSGSYQHTTWTIYENGLLVVKGTGKMHSWKDVPMWVERYKDEIKTARIEVTGEINLKGLFQGCSKLENVDLSGLDTSNVTDMSNMSASFRGRF